MANAESEYFNHRPDVNEEENECCLQFFSQANANKMVNPFGKIIFWVFRWIYSKILIIVNNGTPRAIPTMKNYILMESASSIANRIRNQKTTSVEVVRTFISRIQEVNDVLNCVVDERFQEAMAEAEKADERIRTGAKTAEELEAETPFLGVPFTAPESLAVAGLLNTMGLWHRKSARAKENGRAVSLMREGGAIPLACTNVSESCFACETNNPVFGRTDNPYDTNRSVGGPSGGEACLIASSGSPLGIASFAGLPCAFNGIFGHRPSSSARPDGAGPMSRSSADLLPAMKLLTKDSKVDLKLDEPVDVKKLKYYFMEEEGGNPFTSPVEREIKETINKAVDHFGSSHKASVTRVNLKGMKNAFSIWNFKMKEFRRQKATLTKLEKISMRRELGKALFGKSQHGLIFLLTELMQGKMQARNGNSATKQIEEDYCKLLSEFQELLGSDGVFICPSHPTPAFRHYESLTKGFDWGYAAIFEALGLPATHCPAGLDSDGLPIGFQVVAAMNQDRLTMAVAREVEKAFGGWKPPPTRGTFTLKNTTLFNSLNEKVKTL